MSPAAPIDKLIQIPLFKGLSRREAEGIFSIAEERTLSKDELVFREGDAGDGLYVLLEGSVEILKNDRSGGQHSLAKLSDGTVLGEMSLISGNAPRSASARASVGCKLLKIPSARFSKLLSSDNVAALKISFNLAQVMSRRLLLMDEKLLEALDRGKKKEELKDFQRILSNWSF